MPNARTRAKGQRGRLGPEGLGPEGAQFVREDPDHSLRHAFPCRGRLAKPHQRKPCPHCQAPMRACRQNFNRDDDSGNPF